MTDAEILSLIKQRRHDGLGCSTSAIKKLTGGGTDRVSTLLGRLDAECRMEPSPHLESAADVGEGLPSDARRRLAAQEREWALRAARLRSIERDAANELVWLARAEATNAMDRARAIEAASRSEVEALARVLVDVRAREITVSKALRVATKRCRESDRDRRQLQSEVTRLRGGT